MVYFNDININFFATNWLTIILLPSFIIILIKESFAFWAINDIHVELSEQTSQMDILVVNIYCA